MFIMFEGLTSAELCARLRVNQAPAQGDSKEAGQMETEHVWVSSDGTTKVIAEMPTQYIVNCIEKCKKEIDALKYRVGHRWSVDVNTQAIQLRWYREKLGQLDAELAKRSEDNIERIRGSYGNATNMDMSFDKVQMRKDILFLLHRLDEAGVE